MRAEMRLDHLLVAVALAAATLAVQPASALERDHGDGDKHVWRIDPDGITLGPYELTLHQPYRPLVPIAGMKAGMTAGETADMTGEAARFDGSTTWAQTRDAVTLPLGEGIAIGAWIAFASPPVNDTSILHLQGPEGALRLSVGPWMQPEFRIGSLRAADFTRLPLGHWIHLGATYDGETARLFVDGDEVATAPAGSGEAVPDELSGIMTIGKSQDAGARYETHPLGVFNGVIDALTLRLGAAEPITASAGDHARMPAEAAIGVPENWFADDPHRPRLHPMPPAGWTNEPHTLLLRDGTWHLYHQANPNGAFWESIVWGHLTSDDLVTWQPQLPALMPGTGFDRRGIWVGNRIPGIEPPAVLYTGVDGDRSGLGRADWREGGAFERREPAISYATPPGYQDMRDPFIVRRDEDWLALIGSGTADHSAPLILAFASQDAQEWEFIGEFDTGGAAMPGEYWELPVLLPIAERWLLMGTPVLRDEPTQTLYWIGDFDGTRFIPDDPAPRGFDLFRTLLAPTIAEARDGRLIGIGVVPDDGQRPEAVRARAGWVHALSLPFEIALCEDDPQRLCSAVAGELDDAFSAPDRPAEAATALTDSPVTVTFADDAVRISGEVSVPEGDAAVLALETAGGAQTVARLVLRPAEGRVSLDNAIGPSFDWARTDLLEADISPQERLAIDVVIDGAAITGTLGAQPFSALLYPHESATRQITVSGTGAARLEHLLLREASR